MSPPASCVGTLVAAVASLLLVASLTRADDDVGGDRVKIEVLQEADQSTCERRSKDGDLVFVHYVGTLASDGSQFDASHEEPFSFQLGRKQVIAGWDQGLGDMCVGEKRKLHVPSSLAYGEAGAGERIPPNSDLIFEVQLVNVSDSPPPVNVFKMIDNNDDQQLSREEVSDYLIRQVPEDMKEDHASFNHDQLVEEIFQHEDKDRNGFITHDEFTGPKHDEL